MAECSTLSHAPKNDSLIASPDRQPCGQVAAYVSASEIAPNSKVPSRRLSTLPRCSRERQGQCDPGLRRLLDAPGARRRAARK
jgi:hypothetical protein